MLPTSAEYNRRAAIIEGVRAELPAAEIMRFFLYSKSTVYDVGARYKASEEGTAEAVEWAQELILEIPGQSQTKLATVLGGRPYVFQQDGALAHTSHLVQNALFGNIGMLWSKVFLFPKSPDLNPMDNYHFSVVERVAHETRNPNFTSLQTLIGAAFEKLDRAFLKRA
ncbi:unnamed protein product [Nippostrongylus brasiliensis]|uniref:Transcriptional regulator n=1 Tax=Nippostrongylus brasiliensis TaxID=27835 RepID=A0A0N4Y4I0_NIPBR|nr:unnamed protein product [Nippostrongylus brasiliensis]